MKSCFSPSLGSTVMLIPGSLSLMKGRLPVLRSSFLIRRTFLAQTFPWMRFLSSCEQKWQCESLIQSGLKAILVLCGVTACQKSYQVVHSPCELFSHFELPRNVDTTFVLFQIGVQRTKFTVFLHHHVWQGDERESNFIFKLLSMKHNYKDSNVTSCLWFTAAYFLCFLQWHAICPSDPV